MNTPPQHPPRGASPSDLTDLETFRETIRKADETLLMDFARLLPHAPLPPPPDWPAKYLWPAPPLAALFADLGGTAGAGNPPSAMRSVIVTLSVRADTACMIADAKAALHPADYASALIPPDPDRLMALLTDSAAEERVLRRVADHARAHHPDLPPALVEHLWRTHIIPWTKQVELHHLLHPQPHPSPMSPQSPLSPIQLPPPVPSAALPEPLETAWLALARTETRATADRDALHRLLPDIARLADRFTTARPDGMAPPYLRTTREALAYTLYFAPQTYARATQILNLLPPPAPTADPAPLRLLSLGSGTGADLFALLDHVCRGAGGPSAQPLQIQATALDHSRAALRLLRDVFSTLRPSRWPAASLRTIPAPLPGLDPAAPDAADLPAAAFDFVSLHYVLNELPPPARQRVLSAAARAVAPGGWLILCDPLLHAEGDWLRTLRAWAIENLSPLALRLPCPHTSACPLGEPCHSVHGWTIPRTLQILSTALHRDLRRLDYAFLAFQRPPLPPLPLHAWTVSSAHDLKGRTEVPACLPDATASTLRILHRHCDAPTKKRLRHLDRGTPLLLPPPAP